MKGRTGGNSALTGMYPVLDIRRVAPLEQESVGTTEQEGNGDVQQVQENGGTIVEETPPPITQPRG